MFVVDWLIKFRAISARPIRAVSNWRISLIANDGYGDIVNAPVAGTPNATRSMSLNYVACVIELSSGASAELTVL